MTDQKDPISYYKEVPPGSWSVKGIGTTSYPVQGYGDVNIWTFMNGQKQEGATTLPCVAAMV